MLAYGVMAALVAASSACSGAETVKGNVASEAEAVYTDGLEHLAGGSTLEAEQEFQKLLKMPSYLQLTALARLRLADAQFHEHKYDEAIETYLSFVQRHDSNDNVPYALFMVARAYYELAPSDLWFFPPIEELDLTAVQQARTHLERFIKQYPRSRFVTQALELRERCLDLLWAHHRYVIDFYTKRNKWMGVVYRLHVAMQQFPSRSQNVENFALLAKGYQEIGWRRRAVDVWQAIGQRWPGTPQAIVAPGRVVQLQKDMDAAKAAGKKDAEMPVELPPTSTVKPEQLGDSSSDEG